MDNKKLRKLLSQLVIVGKKKKWFWSKTKDFEMQIYHTPLRNKIIIIKVTGIDESELNFDFKIGDSIDLALNWVEKNGFEIKAEINRDRKSTR